MFRTYKLVIIGQKAQSAVFDVPAIYVFLAANLKTWMPGTKLGMTYKEKPRPR